MRALVLATIVSAIAACAREAPPQETVRPALTRVVATRAVDIAAVYAGEVRARYESDLAFRIGGKVVARAVEVGSSVRRGAVLARLDLQDAQLQVEAVRAQLAAAEADVTLARAELERYRSLRAQNFVAQAVLDARLNAANAAEARLAQMKAQLEVAKNAAAYTTLVAERDGIVTAVNVEPGQVVAAGQPVVRIARPEEKEVAVAVPEHRLAEWKTAAGMTAALWTQPERRYKARVREVAPNADAATRTFSVRVSILDADEAVRLGMTANIALAGAAGAAPIVVPSGALGDDAGKPVVWIVDAQTGRVERRAIEVAAYREDGVVVGSGLAGGERIVVAGVHKLLPGQTVRPVEAP